MINNAVIEVRGKELKLETGKMARQADGSVVARYGDTVILATAVSSKTP
jgi:polyribonucleotide nucleotidyltransferase